MTRKLSLILTVIAAVLVGPVFAAAADEQPAGPIGSGVQLQDEPDPNPVVAPVPMPTNPNGGPMYLSQDGGDGEHASVAVNQGVRDLIQSGNYNNWNLNFGETTLSNETETIFWLKSGDTYFRVTVTPDPSVAPEGGGQ